MLRSPTPGLPPDGRRGRRLPLQTAASNPPPLARRQGWRAPHGSAPVPVPAQSSWLPPSDAIRSSMASSLPWGPDEPTAAATSPPTDGSPNPPTPQTQASPVPMTEQSAPPSPSPSPSPSGNSNGHGVSAAAAAAATILATLSDSRPPTSQGEIGQEPDDDQAGGIPLADIGGDAISMFETYDVTTPPLTLSAEVDEVMHPVGSAIFNDILGQHAAALHSLGMEQVPPPPPSSSGPTLQEFLMSHGGIYELDYEANQNPNEEYLNHLNKDRYLSITNFFRYFMPHGKDDPIELDATPPPDAITRDDLRGDECDMQGINWSLRQTTRAAIRAKRTAFESARLSPQLVAVRRGIVPIPNTETYFSFRRMNTTHQAYIPHFQLRNLMAATSRNDIFYANRDMVYRTDALGAPATAVMDLRREITEAGKFQITSLAAWENVVIAGGFEGEYALTNLFNSYGTPTTIGRINQLSRESKSNITNHVHLFNSRNNHNPQAVLSSNDNRLRILDCETNTFTYSFQYPQAVNCSATSPNGRMRVVVGDFRETLITNAETGQPFETLRTHTDDAFACDWADDGVHVATAAQDSTIVIWDARNWSQPLEVLFSELSIPRSLKFSPVGGGPRVLVSAEADDYVNIINAQTFESRQVFDFFGRTAGISMTPDGLSLFVANSEPHFGGIMEFERCAWTSNSGVQTREDVQEDNDIMADWSPEGSMDHDRRVVCGSHERERRGLNLDALLV